MGAKDGRKLSSRDLGSSFAANPPSYGISTSPLVVGERLIVLVGGLEAHNLVAFERATREVAWSVSHADLASYASPILGMLGGKQQIVVPAGDRLYGAHPDDGRLLWSLDGLPYPDRNPLPLPRDGIFMAFEEAGVMIRLEDEAGKPKATESWRTSLLSNSFSPPVHHDGAVFGFGDRQLVCLDAATGEVLWQHPLAGLHILVDGHLVVLSRMSGKLLVIPANREGFEERLSTTVFETGRFPVTPPSFAHGWIYLRQGSELAAFEIVDGADPEPVPVEFPVPPPDFTQGLLHQRDD